MPAAITALGRKGGVTRVRPIRLHLGFSMPRAELLSLLGEVCVNGKPGTAGLLLPPQTQAGIMESRVKG